MQYIRILPFLLSMSMSIIVSIISYLQGVGQKEIYIRMIISIIVFFALGLFLRNSAEKLYESILKRKDDYDSQAANQALSNKEE